MSKKTDVLLQMAVYKNLIVYIVDCTTAGGIFI